MFETRRETAPLGAHGLSFMVEVANANGEATALFDCGLRGDVLRGTDERIVSGIGSPYKGADNRLRLQTFGTSSWRQLKLVPAAADRHQRVLNFARKRTHLQRQTGVAEVDRSVRPEQEGQSILDSLHGGCTLAQDGSLETPGTNRPSPGKLLISPGGPSL